MFNLKPFLQRGLLALLIGLSGQTAVSAGPPTMESLVTEAGTRNLEIQAAHHRWQQTQAAVGPAAAWPDPMLEFGLMNLLSFKEPQASLTQRIPNLGQLDLEVEVARLEAETARAEWEEKQLAIAQAVRTAYSEGAYLDQAWSLAGVDKALLQGFMRIAQNRYRVGQGMQQDVLQAQLRLTDAMNRLITLAAQREETVAKLNTLRNRPPQEAIPFGGPIDHEGMQHEVIQRLPDKPVPGLATLAAQAEKDHPTLRAARLAIRQAELRVAIARQAFKPEWQLTAGIVYPTTEEQASIKAMAGLSLPVRQQSRQLPMLAAAEAALATAQSRYQAQVREWNGQIQEALARIKRSQEEEKLLRTATVPLSEQNLNAALAAYQVGKIDALTLLESQRMTYESRIAHQRAVADYWQAIARLTYLTGVEKD